MRGSPQPAWGDVPPSEASPGSRIQELLALYQRRKLEIEGRLEAFRQVWEQGSDEDLFAELTFCLCAVQTSAVVCDQATQTLRERGVLLNGGREEVKGVLRSCAVRFHVNKSRWILEARGRFMVPPSTMRGTLEKLAQEPPQLRDWLQEEVLGLGLKEASHFLRNIGLGEDLAILDRHVLRNLGELGLLETLTPSLTRTRYLAIEERFREFCEGIGIPLGHMDLLLWAKETGFVFK